MMRRVRIVCMAIGLALLALPAAAQTVSFGPFVVPDDRPELLILNGPIAPGDGRAFWNAILQLPAVETLVLASPGGSLSDSLVIAELVRGSGLNSWVVPGTECTGTCGLIFMAGIGRAADGALGIAALPASGDTAALTFAEIVALETGRFVAYGATPEFVALRAALAPGESRLLTEGEIAAAGISRSRDDGLAEIAAMPVAPIPPTPDLDAPFVQQGAILRGVIEEIDVAGAVVATREAGVAWSLGGTPENPVVRVEIVATAPAFSVTIYLMRHSYRDARYVGAIATILFAGDSPPPVGGIVALAGIRGGVPVGGTEFLSAGIPAAAGIEAMTMQFLDIFKNTDIRLLAGSDRILLAYQHEADPAGGLIAFDVGDEGRAVFAAAMAVWQGF